ncbi:hypothetical protein [Streptomyces sp. SID3212]|uniref:hypothetical protein n=1 Tax=Streptomyces sp. SID3212 TaxID=2690259 RepID=UPI0013695FEE|nr:hypothetical protein [Streptomyces sp. SID3212]MYV56481.1 hypothetical protein [Streptomyces sp. SID3212]
MSAREAAVQAVKDHPSTTFMAPYESLADAVLTAAAPLVRATSFLEAADVISNDDDCGCGGCDSCIANKLAATLREVAAGGEEKNTSGTSPEAAFTPVDPVLALIIADALYAYQSVAQTETLRHLSQRRCLAEHLAGVLGGAVRSSPAVARADRERAELVTLRTQDTELRGLLSPSGRDRRVPAPVGESVTAVVAWLLDEVERLRPDTMYVAEHEGFMLRAYATQEAAAAHIEHLLVQEDGPEVRPRIVWQVSDPADPIRCWDVYVIDPFSREPVPTGYMITAAGIAAEFDPACVVEGE